MKLTITVERTRKPARRYDDSERGRRIAARFVLAVSAILLLMTFAAWLADHGVGR